MPTFRQKQITIEAEQWTGANIDIPARFPELNYDSEKGKLNITDLIHRIEVKPGDWIVKDQNGNVFPLPPDVFARRYEPDI